MGMQTLGFTGLLAHCDGSRCVCSIMPCDILGASDLSANHLHQCSYRSQCTLFAGLDRHDMVCRALEIC